MKVFIASAYSTKLEEYLTLAKDVSEVFASRNFDLLFGAANESMMGACYKAFIKHNRKVYACTVPKYERDFKKIPKAKCIRVKDTLLRFKKLYFGSDYTVILPGGIGTLAEFTCALEEYRASLGNKKIILVNYNGFYDKIIKWMKENIDTGFISNDLFEQFIIVKKVNEIEKLLDEDLKEM